MQSLKKNLVVSLAASTTLDELKENRVVLVTSAGIITGRLPSESEESKAGILVSLANKLRDDYLKENQMPEIDGNDGYLNLVDVAIISGEKTISRLNHLVVFFDQVVGVSIGSDSNLDV